MIFRTPDYFKKFKCKADKCKDCCCIGWEIDIDNHTSEIYKNTKGKFGERLKNNISNNSFILDGKERCPFLNKDNLCDIIIEKGNNYLCDICREHPRYYEWYDDLKEGGIGLCCEEAVSIILSLTHKPEYIEKEIEDEDTYLIDNNFFNFLYEAREKIINHIYDENIDFNKRLCDILDFSEKLQSLSDNEIFKIPEMYSESSNEKYNLKPILQFIKTLEPIDKNWIPYIDSIIGIHDTVILKVKELRNTELNRYYTNISAYFIYRYFLKGVFTGEFLSSVKFMAISIAIIEYMFLCKHIETQAISFDDCIEIVKNYSKQMEYCEQNMEIISEQSYTNPIFSTSVIKGLFQ